MRIAKIVWVVMAAALAGAACDRGRTADETARPDVAAEDRQRQQDETASLEQRVNEVEEEWKQAEQRLSRETTEAATAARREIEEGVAEVRQAVAELRNTNAENWWDRYERDLEQEADEIEQDVRRFARRWTPADTREVGTAGDETSWEARRDRLVARIEARIEAMEEAFKDVDSRTAREVEETRGRVGELREDTNRLRRASEDQWWEVTRERIENYIERLEASIERQGNDSASPRNDRS
jgi:DNA repair exonuclease SbcCD ATPase subunit